VVAVYIEVRKYLFFLVAEDSSCLGMPLQGADETLDWDRNCKLAWDSGLHAPVPG